MTRLIAAFLSLVAGAAPAWPTPAAGRFDGTWSVEILTESGTCDRAYRYPVRIDGGKARFVGTAFVIDGGVARSGALKGRISNGAATADVAGRLGTNGFGSGTWAATGALSCRGRWSAERRG